MCGSRRPKRLRFGPCSTRIFILLAPVGRVPVLFQIADERGAEMALCLLASVHRHVAAEQVEGFLPGADRAPVARGAHDSRAGQLFDRCIDGLVHFFVWDDFVTEHPSHGAGALDAQLGHDRLARDPVADEARQAQVRGARDDAFLAGGQREVRVFGGERVIDREENLAVPTDRKTLHGGDPDLLDRSLFRRFVFESDAAVELVYEAEIANQVPEVANPALIKVREVDPGAEEPPPFVLRVVDEIPAQYAHLALAIEQREVDRDLHALEGRLVLGVEIAGVAHRQQRGFALSLESDAGQLELPAAVVFGHLLCGPWMRKKHRVAKVGAGGRVGEDLGDESALRLLQALLFLEGQPCFGRELVYLWQRPFFGRDAAQLVHPDEALAPRSELVVEGQRVDFHNARIIAHDPRHDRARRPHRLSDPYLQVADDL